MFCAIWYYLYNLKDVKNTHGGFLLLVKLQAFNTSPWVFFTFLNCTNCTKSRNASYMQKLDKKRGVTKSSQQPT